jgi:hypothetical protein
MQKCKRDTDAETIMTKWEVEYDYENIQWIPLNKISKNDNVRFRSGLDAQVVDSIMCGIKENGPESIKASVVEDLGDGTFELLGGNHRYTGFETVDCPEIPAYVIRWPEHLGLDKDLFMADLNKANYVAEWTELERIELVFTLVTRGWDEKQACDHCGVPLGKYNYQQRQRKVESVLRKDFKIPQKDVKRIKARIKEGLYRLLGTSRESVIPELVRLAVAEQIRILTVSAR